MADLLGLNVLNTRPLARAVSLQNALLATGARVQQLPLLEIDALPLTAEAQQWLRDLDRYRWVFVVSPTAAELGLQHLGLLATMPLDVQWRGFLNPLILSIVPLLMLWNYRLLLYRWA